MEALNEKDLTILRENLLHIETHPEWTTRHKANAWFDMLKIILEMATAEEKIQFTTLFSRLAFTGVKYALPGHLLYYCHIFRKGHEKHQITPDNEQYYDETGAYICFQLVQYIWHIQVPEKKMSESCISFFATEKKSIKGFKSLSEAVLFKIDEYQKTLHFYDEEDPSEEKTALYDVPDKNELFTSNIESVLRHFTLPLHINFIDIDIREDGMYIPMAWVIHPDHMIDVTSISECFKDFGAEPMLFLISRFKEQEFSTTLMVGNLVNLMLDEIIHDPQTRFKDLLLKMFHTDPLGFAFLDDDQLKNVMHVLQEHFQNLSQVIQKDFTKHDIASPRIYLEPSFYSRDYGIQGRLDLLHQRADGMSYDIIELKSGKTFKPNTYGINASHYIQTLLYDLMVRSAFQSRAQSFKYILYSRESSHGLRYAPPVRQQQYEALKIRNDIMAIIEVLKTKDGAHSVFSYVKPAHFPKLKGFNSIDIAQFHQLYAQLNASEKSYFDHMAAFITREYAIARTGGQDMDRSHGHAALWLESDFEKKQRFALLSPLEIVNNQSAHDDSYIVFSRNDDGDNLVNFRVGDIAVIYPEDPEKDRPILKNQIFKGSISDIQSGHITIRLRNKQFNQRIFEENLRWNMELDSMDSSFIMMYKNLYMWAKTHRSYRDLMLGLRPPASRPVVIVKKNKEGMTAWQSQLMDKALSSEEYFLLWGPPGTGKTSVMLKNMVSYLHQNTEENILLLAYTNRAVDEICEAVSQIGQNMQDSFIRIGSRLGTAEKFHNQLLDVMIKKVQTRRDILHIIQEKRIVISTLSSFFNKYEIRRLKKFDTVIVDEASQILEPMIIGLLEPFKRRILIGDHKQMPAVVVQNPLESKIDDKNLNNAGIDNARTSFFERLYKQAMHHQWHHAYGILNEQGRMHNSLMTFPNDQFYGNHLTTLPQSDHQFIATHFEKYPAGFSWLSNRLIYIPTKEDHDINWKTNQDEANICLNVIYAILNLYKANDQNFHATSLGIITPYRAQIALITKKLSALPESYRNLITVDTVERYQGSARDIIIYSFCVNKKSQLEALVSSSDEGVDRKLNVALTRARQQIILLGSEKVLRQNPTYEILIDSATSYPPSTVVVHTDRADELTL